MGGGGMSRVFLAEETALGRRVVVKVLLPELAAGVSVERFRREIQLVAKLQHPHIVPVHAAGESGGLPYFTMPFVEGESLRTRIARDGELPIAETVRLLRDIASALAYAHAQGVIHRDIKPDNVLLSAGSAVVADFGVAKAISSSTTSGEVFAITSTGMALGTPAYMAPEQAAGDPAMDHRVDIYAFGVTAYEMIAGRPPFTGRTPQAILAAQVTETPIAIQSLRPSMPAALAALVMRCLEKHAADRPSVADEILHSLDAMATPASGSTPTQTVPAISSATAPVPVRRHRLALGGTALGVGIIALGLVLWMRGRSPVPIPDQPTDSVPAAGPSVITPGAPAATPDDRSAAPVESAASAPAPVRRPRPAETAVNPAPKPAPDTGVVTRLRIAALAARQSAVGRGVVAEQLARGDTLLAGGDSLLRARRPDQAGIAYSAAGASWTNATPHTEAREVQPPAVAPKPVPQPPARQPPADPRPAIEAVVSNYASAIESERTQRIRQVYPNLTAGQEQDWRQFFDAVDDVDVQLDIAQLAVSGDSAEATVTGVYRFANSTTHKHEQQPVTIRMSLIRNREGAWSVATIR
ncbi:MAG TPA: protein kinase [Gemmatimonadales bacterium]|nr:protein kinase [Gemmatimonadales bacterium]